MVPTDERPHSFKLITHDRILHVFATNDAERARWLDQIRVNIALYGASSNAAAAAAASTAAGTSGGSGTAVGTANACHNKAAVQHDEVVSVASMESSLRH